MPDMDYAGQLLEKLQLLIKRQEDFSKEINELRNEISRLQNTHPGTIVHEAQPVKVAEEKPIAPHTATAQLPGESEIKPLTGSAGRQTANRLKEPAFRRNIEKFIGEDLINKIGIIITVIGVGIGTKYSIDHQLINPVTRIVLGYLAGLALLFLAVRVKKNYLSYSAVLVSGGTAILYFITYSAYGFYGLIPQSLAFILMFVFTVFTVWAAWHYDKQVIAFIGALGAYAVPLLLGDSSGNITIFFTYIAIINTGIFGIALKKYWKPLYYAAFGLTWAIYILWYVSRYDAPVHQMIPFIFACIFFITFYGTFLGYKLLQKKEFATADIVLLLSNAFIFYGLGYSILAANMPVENVSGPFTLANAAFHFCISLVIYYRKAEDKNPFYLVGGLALIFITIAVPVQLNGNWVTLLWTFEATLLFWIGRIKKASFYEFLSYPLMVLALVSLVQDWFTFYQLPGFTKSSNGIHAVLNSNFLTSLLCIACFSAINFINQRKSNTDIAQSRKQLFTVMQLVIPAILLIVLYFSFEVQIANYWNREWIDAAGRQPKNAAAYFTFENSDIFKLKTIWIINYSLLFFGILGFVNNWKIRNDKLGSVHLFFSIIFAIIFLTQGLYVLYGLQESRLNNNADFTGSTLLGIRYFSLLIFGGLLASVWQVTKQDFVTNQKEKLNVSIELFLHFCFVWMMSSELINWMTIFHFTRSDKLMISIAWGLYALVLIILGIWKKKKYLRLGAIVLLLVTLIKLFFYDISGLNNITKTIVFVSLGVLLLIISFLYNKYRVIISGEK